MKKIFDTKVGQSLSERYTHSAVFNSRISTKLFAITALAFTTVLICSMLAQAYYFNRMYIVYQIIDPNKYREMVDELNKSDMSAGAVSKTLNKYKDKYEIEAAIFLSDRITPKFQQQELSEYPYSLTLQEGIDYYLSNINFRLEKQDNYFEKSYIATDGHIYNVAAASHLNGNEILFAIYPDKKDKTPGLIDQYYIYVFVIGIFVSVLLSYFFSLIVSRPLVNINKIANNMANLNFNKKIKFSSNDELGQLSNSLNTMSEKLDSTLKELTAANLKLEADIEREREIEKARKEFVANVSHELKTPLAIIKGYSSALKDNVREDKKEHYLNQIIRQSNGISKLVEDMLELSRIESGHYQPQTMSFDLTMLTQNILDDLRFLAEEKNLNLVQEYSSPAIKILADHMKIGQVIKNFIHNAIRYTPENGNIFIRISEKEKCVHFEVENEGINIAPDKLNKVWGRFYREEEARNKKTGGTGLGLALSEKILQAHSMDYGVENTNCGVMFYFSVNK